MLHRLGEVLRRSQGWHPLPALPTHCQCVISDFVWGIRALSVGITLVAINLSLLLLFFNVKIIVFHCLFSFDVAWLSNAHNKLHWQRDCTVKGGRRAVRFILCYILS